MAKKFFLFLLVILVFGLSACGTTPAGSPSGSAAAGSEAAAGLELIEAGCTNPYFPVVNGANWGYTSSGGVGGSYGYISTISSVSDTGFMIDNAFNDGLLASVEWTCAEGNLTTLDTGQSAAVGTSGMTTVINSAAATGYTIPVAFAEGQEWTYVVLVNATNYMDGTEQATADSQTSFECKYEGTQAITVPAGTFNSVYYKCSIINTATVYIDGVAYGPISTVWDSTTWLAEGVGIVQVTNEGDSGDEMVVLVEYSIPLH